MELFKLDDDEVRILDKDVLINLKAKRLQLTGEVDACYDVLKCLDLVDLIEYIDDFNPSRLAPYHNAKHEAAVVVACYEGAFYHQLTREQTRGLILGAALHDFDHTAGKEDDDVNIKRALDGLRYIDIALSTTPSAVSPGELKIAYDVIKVTRFPFVHEPTTIEQKIIRDADLMMAYIKDKRERVELFLGLKAEIELTKGPIVRQEFAGRLREFYREVIWHTQWALEKNATQRFYNKLDALHDDITYYKD